MEIDKPSSGLMQFEVLQLQERTVSDRHDQPQRWIADGLEKLGDGIKWAGAWIGLGMCFKEFILFLNGKL